jgi:hypothetical protein
LLNMSVAYSYSYYTRQKKNNVSIEQYLYRLNHNQLLARKIPLFQIQFC